MARMMFVYYELERIRKWSPQAIPLFAFGGLRKITNALVAVVFTLV
jgi:hypothetical protein